MKRRVLLDLKVIEALDALPVPLRAKLWRRLAQIGDAPESFCQYVEKDDAGRELDGHICEGYAILYWNDFADRHVKILEIHSADR